MGNPDLHRHVEVSDHRGAVASADVTITQQAVRTARASLRTAAGHLAPGSRARLVDAVLDLPELHNGGRLEAAFPLGDSETLHRLRQRCTDVTTRPAGSTVLLEATIGPAIPPAPRDRKAAMRGVSSYQPGPPAMACFALAGPTAERYGGSYQN